MKVEQAYQMILRQFDTEIGGKAEKLDELEKKLETKKKNYEKWKIEVSDPMKLK